MAAVVVLAVVGAVPAWRLCQRPLEACVMSPALGALVLTPGAALAIATDIPVLICATVGVVGIVGPVGIVGGRLPRWQPQVPLASTIPLVLVAAVVVATYLRRPPVEWDTHSIWLLRADWFATGGSEARATIRLASFAHPDYPPLLPAAAGTASRIATGGLDWRAAQAAITAVGWSLFLTAQLVVLDGVRNRLVGIGAGVLTTLVVTASLAQGVASGEADLAAAASISLVAAALVFRREPMLLGVGLVGATIAASVKGESLTAAIVVIAVALLVRGRQGGWWWCMPIVAAVGWVVVTRRLGAESYLLNGSAPGPGLLERAGQSACRLLGELGRPTLGAAVAVALAALTSRPARRSLLPIVAVAGGSLAALVGVYAIGPLPIEQWLDDSARRVSVGPLVVAMLAASIAVDESVSALRQDSPMDAQRD